jgi:50S ribosomal subunit-associated GTPase HflX
MGLKKDFPEFKEKNFLLNFLRETVKLVSNKQDDKFQGRELLNLFKSNLKELAKEIIMAQYVGIRDKLKDELLPSVKQYMKKLELDVKDAITITNSIVDKLCNKENNNKSPALREIIVRELTEARMKTFLEKVKEINLAPNNVPSSSMSNTNNTVHVLSLSNARAVGQR